MDKLLIIQLAISFTIGGLFIALQTLLAERVPPFWRGIIITIPSTMAMGLLFIGIAKSPQDAASATQIIPASEGISYLYLTVFILLSLKFHAIICLLGSVISWILATYLLLKFPPDSYTISTIYLIITIPICYLLTIRLPQDNHIKIFPLNLKNIFLRSLLGGTIIAIAVLLSKTMGNIWGGIFSTFPAVFTSTLLIYYHLQGPHVLPAIAKSLYFPGTIGFVVYAYTVFITFPKIGALAGTLASYIVLMIFLLLWNLIFKNRKITN
ncbi:MAG: DUF3147 family protein [Candidatus Gracilibacteria bacterium]|jgi:uncharacterized membrane protein (GlpM family)